MFNHEKELDSQTVGAFIVTVTIQGPGIRNIFGVHLSEEIYFGSRSIHGVCKTNSQLEHAPTRIRSRNMVYDDPEWLRTSIGFWNILCFCGVFYGSPFARDDGRHFESLDDWNAFKENKAESHFVVKSAYGSLQGDRVPEYWEKRHLWEPLINKKDLSLTEVYQFLPQSSVDGGRSEKNERTKGSNKATPKKVFVNIGSLTAILIIGDLVYAGILPMPSPLEWGEFIGKVSKGALDAITMLGLIDEDTTVPQAFVELDKFVNRVLTAEEKAAMTYDVLTGEHGLLLLQMLQKDIHLHL
ncbi:uncharacterized protein LACBIDRAFT_334225 [Laccaria bicolor S238N-H82]|uniref:Predicted protein n=1 Tax=Laccaria bicolor (strain S238N-H82 / ATCC MYA-4686) TaxID=486041 RepID=B0DYI6_LACBS|nr:uncharacterized protein LACBIDRAFT_334225 [Laccaria bicolor S238N-H82]EDR00300.1 predicted protein [Laccaria bicolor S238N-H82]|eukprot:XP_001889052.1 predicted protein [Laccaria bicolor S238N-H82]